MPVDKMDRFQKNRFQMNQSAFFIRLHNAIHHQGLVYRFICSYYTSWMHSDEESPSTFHLKPLRQELPNEIFNCLE